MITIFSKNVHQLLVDTSEKFTLIKDKKVLNSSNKIANGPCCQKYHQIQNNPC
jgi:hypothetical protein